MDRYMVLLKLLKKMTAFVKRGKGMGEGVGKRYYHARSGNHGNPLTTICFNECGSF